MANTQVMSRAYYLTSPMSCVTFPINAVKLAAPGLNVGNAHSPCITSWKAAAATLNPGIGKVEIFYRTSKSI